MTKRQHSVYVEDWIYEKAVRLYGERGVSQAIEALFIKEFDAQMLRCQYCRAEFSSAVWQKRPALKGKCIECGASESNLVVI